MYTYIYTLSIATLAMFTSLVAATASSCARHYVRFAAVATARRTVSTSVFFAPTTSTTTSLVTTSTLRKPFMGRYCPNAAMSKGQQSRLGGVRRNASSSSSSGTTTTTAESVARTPSAFAERAQLDRSVYMGLGWLGLGTFVAYGVSDNTKTKSVVALVETMRALGLNQALDDARLIGGFFKTNLSAGINVIAASPAFYFSWHLIHGEGVATCLLRSVTGTLRIVPFMGIFYGSFAVVLPFVTAHLMGEYGQEFEAAKSNTMMGALLSGFAFLESVIELRGCGVAYSQLRPGHFAIFVPAIIGRIAAGVLTQFEKVGAEFHSIAPEAWGDPDAPAALRAVARVCEVACIDISFFTTLLGTSVFQHILNAVTYVVLKGGRAAGAKEVGVYLARGIGGTYASGAAQLARTVGMRFAFCLTWNWCSSQEVVYPSLDTAAKELEAAAAAAAAAAGAAAAAAVTQGNTAQQQREN